MVDVHATVGHHAARPPRHARAAHQAGGQADETERADEPDQGEEEEPALPEAVPRPVDDRRERRVHRPSLSDPRARGKSRGSAQYSRRMSDWEIVNLREVEDSAPTDEVEARFARRSLGSRDLGVSLF